MQKLLYVTPHLSTGGAPQYLLKKVELLKDQYDIHVIEYQDLGIFRVQKDKLVEVLKNPLITLGEKKDQLLELIEKIQPEIVHFEEMPELFDISDDIARQIYTKNRKYKIFETSHDSAFDPANKRFFPDKFLFCSDNQLIRFRSIDTPACVVEYPEYNYQRVNREQGLKDLNLDPEFKHILNVGLFTSRKNQGEIFDYANQLKNQQIQFHFIGNQAPNFKYYWEPLMKNKPENCIIWGERTDVEKFYSCMDLFLFTSRGHAGDKETNPLVLKEALSWNIPILMHKIDSYLDKYDRKATFLSPNNSVNYLRIKRMLDLNDGDINCSLDFDGDMSKSVKINLSFSESAFDVLQNKLICIYDLGNKLCIMRSRVLAQHMFVQPSCLAKYVNGFIVKIFDVSERHFSSLSDINKITHHNLLFETSFNFNRDIDETVVDGKKINVEGIVDDPSAWFTLSEVFISRVYDKMKISEHDVVLDIGGHFGFFSLYALQQKAKEVHVIEPTHLNYKILSKNLHGFDNVKKYNFALDQTVGEKEFLMVGSSSTNSFYESYNTDENNPTSLGKTKSISVNTMTFENFVNNNKIDRIDAIKMDCEGAEWDILPTIPDDFLKYKVRKISIELHQFNNDKDLEYHLTRSEELQSRFESLGFEVERSHSESDQPDEKGLGQLWAKRYPKIKVVHMLCDVNGQREKESIRHINKLCEVSNWEYEQSINERYIGMPPKDTCARPDAVQLEPGDYKLTGPHYGNYMAHRRVFEEYMIEDYDAILFCECDAIFIKPPREVFKLIIDSYDDLLYNNLNYMSFGKRIPDWHYEEYENFGVTDRMSEAHCYLIPTNRRQYFIDIFENTGWDTYDLWLNNFVFPDEKCGIVKEPLSIQCSGDSYLDKSHKDGTTLLKDGDITYEL